MFTINVGTWDRRIRVAGGLIIVSLVFWGPKTNWGWLGLLPVAVGMIRVCPAYSLLGINTAQT